MRFFTKGLLCIPLIALGFQLSAVSFAQSSNLGSIEMQFCNNKQKTNEIDAIIKAGQKTPLCIQFTNISNQKLTVNVEFVDAVLTDDAFKDRACNAPDRPKTQFANFMQEYTHTIVLQSGATVKNDYMVQFPIGFEGLSHGCMVYNIIEDEQQKNDFFTVMVRSAKFIDMFVISTDPIISTRISSPPTIIKKGNRYAVRLGMQNNGNIDENIVIQGTVVNILGYQKEFSFQEIVHAGTGKIFESNQFILPFYRGPFMITTQVSYQPQFNFNLTDGKKPLQNIQGGTFTTRNIVIIRNIRFGIFVGGIALIFWLIFKKNPKLQKN